jgi:hypothetical protein
MTPENVLDYTRCIQDDEKVKKEIDAWILLGICGLCQLIRKQARQGTNLTDEEKIELAKVDELLEKHRLPKIFLAKYGGTSRPQASG